jgi:hypothetical protein
MKPESKLTGHERFGELSALAAGGQLSPDDYTEWKTHLADCADCRAEYASFASITSDHLPLLHEDKASPRLIGNKLIRLVTGEPGCEQRFLAKARGQGYPLGADAGRDVSTSSVTRPFFTRPPAYVYPVVLVLIFVIGIFMHRTHLSESQNAARVREISRLNEELAALRQQVSDLSQKQESSLSQSKAQSAELALRGDALEAQLKGASAQIRVLLSEVATYEGKENDLTSHLQQSQREIGALTNELQSVRGLRAQDTATILEQRTRLEQVQQQYRAELEAINREKSLLAADRDIRDLMGARNLHIVDVFDVDGKGRTQKPFGRVFYTEGKSLIFYAFDLGGKRPSVVNASFQAWGAQEVNEHQAQSLGIFYQDDKAQNRWALKFNDPSVLATIDYVFVTVEPSGGSKTPSAHKVLYAYLNTKPNHP